MSTTDDEVEQLLRRTREARERCNNRMALIGKQNNYYTKRCQMFSSLAPSSRINFNYC